MNYLIKSLKAFTKYEACMWIGSVAALIILYAVSGGGGVIAFVAPILGVTALIFQAKGNVLGQILVIIFSFMYAYTAWTFHYYGEVVTYLGMTMPSAVAVTISWIKNLHSETEVAIAETKKSTYAILAVLTVIMTIIFYFILKALDTPNLGFSTVSVTTSFFAAGLCFLRNRFFSLAYMCNDIVLVILWVLASMTDLSYLSMVLNFVVFAINDFYIYYSWRKINERQKQER
ncbi:MAG: nicotinamide riboside transporter PnuC [Firmicutes bacterium]|nr:nicotinamide riboside transporter PnuC [Bacillota bacterium]